VRRHLAIVAAIFVVVGLVTTRAGNDPITSAAGTQDIARVMAHVVATGIPGAGAITQIGTFHQGGPFHDNAALIGTATAPGNVLDRTRLFVASTSNFGAPLAIQTQPEGSILSIDVSGARVDIPNDFASATTVSNPHPVTAGGAAFLYTAQSPAFLNSVNLNTGAVTAGLPAVSLPQGISLNNGFGRPWFANVPSGSPGDGTITVIDPNGAPLRGAPSTVAGRRIRGDGYESPWSDRPATCTLGWCNCHRSHNKVPEPATNGRAVFLAALADGSIAQVHVQRGVSDLAAPGSFTAIAGITTEKAESAGPSAITRVGMVFNWVPVRTSFRERSDGGSHSCV
jgi:hypothetical protein